VRKLLRSERGRIGPNEQTWEMRFINERGETEVWLVDQKFWASITPEFTKASYIDDGIDSRITNQARSISRLLDHVRTHCPDLNCGFKWDGDE
jgi:hypothetical protein